MKQTTTATHQAQETPPLATCHLPLATSEETGIRDNAAFLEVLAFYEDACGALRAAPVDLEHTDKAAHSALATAYDTAYDALYALLDALTARTVATALRAPVHAQPSAAVPAQQSAEASVEDRFMHALSDFGVAYMHFVQADEAGHNITAHDAVLRAAEKKVEQEARRAFGHKGGQHNG